MIEAVALTGLMFLAITFLSFVLADLWELRFLFYFGIAATFITIGLFLYAIWIPVIF